MGASAAGAAEAAGIGVEASNSNVAVKRVIPVTLDLLIRRKYLNIKTFSEQWDQLKGAAKLIFSEIYGHPGLSGVDHYNIAKSKVM